jgi:hypothetical protein
MINRIKELALSPHVQVPPVGPEDALEVVQEVLDQATMQYDRHMCLEQSKQFLTMSMSVLEATNEMVQTPLRLEGFSDQVVQSMDDYSIQLMEVWSQGNLRQYIGPKSSLFMSLAFLAWTTHLSNRRNMEGDDGRDLSMDNMAASLGKMTHVLRAGLSMVGMGWLIPGEESEPAPESPAGTLTMPPIPLIPDLPMPPAPPAPPASRLGKPVRFEPGEEADPMEPVVGGGPLLAEPPGGLLLTPRRRK